jgi:hypothetical protein
VRFIHGRAAPGREAEEAAFLVLRAEETAFLMLQAEEAAS